MVSVATYCFFIYNTHACAQFVNALCAYFDHCYYYCFMVGPQFYTLLYAGIKQTKYNMLCSENGCHTYALTQVNFIFFAYTGSMFYWTSCLGYLHFFSYVYILYVTVRCRIEGNDFNSSLYMHMQCNSLSDHAENLRKIILVSQHCKRKSNQIKYILLSPLGNFSRAEVLWQLQNSMTNNNAAYKDCTC